MTDEEYVAAVEQGIRVTRARVAELKAAIQKAIELDPVSDEVVATFDGDGYLCGLVIEPTALTSHTYTELEDLITDVLREGNLRLRELVLAAVDRFWGSDSSWQELKALGEEW